MSNRTRAAATLLICVALVPAYILWFGLPVLWQDWAREMRRAWLTLVRGTTGPYRGVMW